MIRDSKSRHSPCFGTFQKNRCIGNAVHVAHLRMAVQLHTLLVGIIHTGSGKVCNFLNTHHGTDSQLVIETVQSRHTLELYKTAC